jgi:uncharacterized protein (DUF488 family)
MKCFAIGYQGKSLVQLCDDLEASDVDLLIDVRERAWSNRPQFRKTALSNGLASRGIEYVHVREAGNPFRPRAGEVIDAAECMARYRGYLTATPAVIAMLLRVMRGRRPALLCYEADSSNCHRGVLLQTLQSSVSRFRVTHL